MDLLIWNSFIRQVYILPRDLALPQTEASPAVSQEHLLPTLSQPQGAQSSVQGRRRDFLQKNVRPLPGGAWQRGGCHCWKVEFLSVAICSSQIKDNTEVRVKVPNHCSKGKLKTKQELIRSAFFLWYINITSSLLSSGSIISCFPPSPGSEHNF